ncbi:hypothetical protein HYC85_000867 [Camellia sinensis]|uniref:Uncharacterized protein n=1 Tax=Camellia sinensis TaxID=4442 RepID=A0A7J7I694_CAMSI|nr:hypothetical protein HYC85_000867 [Camellia sinensis]
MLSIITLMMCLVKGFEDGFEKRNGKGVYSFCDGPSLSRGPYLGVATVCSVPSLVFVSIKASLFGFDDSGVDRGRYGRAMEVGLFLSSMVLGMGHVAVAYRTSCRERRKLLVYKIDIEARRCPHAKMGLQGTKKILQENRVK